ncbi:MAG: hypothetical protein JXR25_03340 [Pontiellaceae bacterium]|nr:hypothetical protein [Pontiellaceae bacterium]MBN2783837.1 hypothetical protein [Pontiellaceae bacterium]
MFRAAIWLVAFSLGCMCVVARAEIGMLQAEQLQCEHLVDPVGVDVAKPRLGWVVTSVARNQKQTAYQVLVATRAEQFAQGRGDLWDSGKVESDQTIDITYAGKPLNVGSGRYEFIITHPHIVQAPE